MTTLAIWQAITAGPQDWHPGMPGQFVYHAVTGYRVGYLSHTTGGLVLAHRDGVGTGQWRTTRGAALADVSWLDTVPVDAFTLPAGMVQALPAGLYRARLILADGSTVCVHDVAEETRDKRPVVVLTVTASAPGRVDLDAARPVRAVHADAFIARDRVPVYRLMYPADARLALAPPCDECEAPAGAPCEIGCPSEAI